jgi:outer membrane protein TolC
MKNKILIITLLLIFPFVGFSQTDSTLALSLKDAQQFAIEHNLSLKNARLDIKSAEKKVWETTAIGLPQVSGKLDYQYIPGTIPALDFVDFETGDPVQLPLAVKNSTTYSVTAAQLIFSGEYIVGLQASKTYLQISKLSNDKEEIETRANVLNSYASVLILENNLGILNASLQNMESLVNETKKLAEQGFMESTDVDQLQITLNTLTNTRNTIQRQIDVSYKLFKILLGTDQDAKIVLNQDLKSIYNEIVGKPVNEGFDITNNIDFKMVENQLKISELSLKREKTTYLPTISGFYMYQDKTNKASFDATINHIIGINLAVPIFSSFQRNAVVQQAKIEYQKSLNNKVLLEQNINTQAQQLRFNYQNALEKYKVTNQNVDLSKNVFENTSKKYKQGMVSSMDLTQANNTYLQAESDNTNALFELLQTKIELEKILNEL